MVQTVKFSQFYDAGEISNNNITVGIDASTNAMYNNPWTFLPPGTTGDRPTPAAGNYYRLRLNVTTQLYEYYDPIASEWLSFVVDPPFLWSVITTSPYQMMANSGNITNSSGLISLILPTVSNIGDEIGITGQGSGGWRIIQGNLQLINIGSSATTEGSSGSVTSSNQSDSLTLVCIVANLEWTLVGAPQSSGLIIV